MATAVLITWQVFDSAAYGKSWRTVAGPWVVHKDRPHYITDVFHVTSAEWRIYLVANATTYPYTGTMNVKIFDYYSNTIVKEVDVPVSASIIQPTFL